MTQSGPANTILTLVALAALGLIWGALVLYRRTGERRRPTLMVIAALVLFGNVLIWTLPV